MTKREIAKEALERKLEAYRKYQLFTEKQKLDEQTEIISNQIKTAEQVRLINETMAREYLAQLKKAYNEHLAKEQFKEWREQVLNFNDDYVTGMERLFILRKEEKKNIQQSAKEGFSLKSWKMEIERDSDASGSSGNNERDEITHDKQEEREEEKVKET